MEEFLEDERTIVGLGIVAVLLAIGGIAASFVVDTIPNAPSFDAAPATHVAACETASTTVTDGTPLNDLGADALTSLPLISAENERVREFPAALGGAPPQRVHAARWSTDLEEMVAELEEFARVRGRQKPTVTFEIEDGGHLVHVGAHMGFDGTDNLTVYGIACGGDGWFVYANRTVP